MTSKIVSLVGRVLANHWTTRFMIVFALTTSIVGQNWFALGVNVASSIAILWMEHRRKLRESWRGIYAYLVPLTLFQTKGLGESYFVGAEGVTGLPTRKEESDIQMLWLGVSA